MSIYTFFAILVGLTILLGLHLMSNVKTAVLGNKLSAGAMAVAILITMIRDNSFSSPTLWVAIIVGTAFGLWLANKVKMIQMPQLVAFLHGFGGGAAALVGIIMLADVGTNSVFQRFDACLALCSGMTTIAGSFVAAGKLHQLLPQRPVILPRHSLIVNILLGIMGLAILVHSLAPEFVATFWLIVMFLTGALFGIVFTMRVGGADMPITISLLNSMGGVSCAIAGLAVKDPLLVAVGGIIGSAGLMLTRVMCKAMNRSLMPILLGESTKVTPSFKSKVEAQPESKTEQKVVNSQVASPEATLTSLLTTAKRVIIVPGYGMALAQAQHKVKQLADVLEARGASVDYAIHPVAGRMPGHMNVLLAEANVDYEHMLEMDVVNPMFAEADLAIVIGANDVINPAANTAKDTPIYGMPVLDVDKATAVIICNYDTKPGYAGVDNPLYTSSKAILQLGDAQQTVDKLVQLASGNPINAIEKEDKKEVSTIKQDCAQVLNSARRVIIVPGYGMALAQAQHKVKQLADALEARGASVDYAIHPVAGRMPGHMNVLLAEANVDYEHMLEMDVVNPMFAEADLAIVIGANDVINPAANTAKDTPIYGMPVLDVDKAAAVIICNYDTKPGYAGVDNPLYTKQGVTLLQGDAIASLDKLLEMLHKSK